MAALIFLTVSLSIGCILAADGIGCYNADPESISVSGVSSGATFAHQFHVAYSKTVIGAGIVAGSPYYCAKGQWNRAQTTCLNSKTLNPKEFVKYVHDNVDKHQIDVDTYLRRSRVYVHSDGSKDNVVIPSMLVIINIDL
jgi:poly(3-hydroxybutyrate) depolymerase